MTRTLERSVDASEGVASKSMRTAGTRNISVMRSVAIRSSNTAGSTSRTMTDRPPRDIAHSAQPEPPMWKRGMATRLTVSSVMLKVSPASPTAVDRLALVSITPLGKPVVPEVYSCMLTSLRSPTWPGSSGGHPATHCSKVTAAGRHTDRHRRRRQRWIAPTEGCCASPPARRGNPSGSPAPVPRHPR